MKAVKNMNACGGVEAGKCLRCPNKAEKKLVLQGAGGFDLCNKHAEEHQKLIEKYEKESN